MEIWKDIVGYEGLYQVSNLGRVKSLDRVVDDVFMGRHRTRTFKGRVLSPKSNKHYGYMEVNLYDSFRNPKTFKVHRLVAVAFVPNPNNLLEVNHKDENVLNNSATNLEWCDRWYNTHYGSRNERLRFKALFQHERKRLTG